MPYTPHFLFSYGGTIGTQGEIWSNNIRFHSAADLDADPDEAAWLAAAQPFVSALMTGSGSKIASNTKCTYLKLNKIGADGHYVSNTESNTRFLSGASIITGASVPRHPFQVSLAITWLTDFARGRGSKGRIFSPSLTAEVDEEGRIGPTDTLSIANAYKSFLNSLGGIGGVPGDALKAVVASGINGAVNPIKSVSVGNVPDTMRSRRNKLVEARSNVTL